jgi:phospholipid transport system substrate-binding protein
MHFLIPLLALFFSTFVSSNNFDKTDPNQVIHFVSINTFARIQAESDRLQTEPAYINVVIEEELLPYFDYKYASYKVMGVYLKETSKEQRTQFVDVFRTYLVHTYGHLLYKYEQQEIEIIDNKNFKDKNIVIIAVNVNDKKGQTTKLSFKLRKNKKTGEWKVFDVIAEGISMLNTKRSELNDLLQKKGIDHVIELLEKKNSEFSS